MERSTRARGGAGWAVLATLALAGCDLTLPWTPSTEARKPDAHFRAEPIELVLGIDVAAPDPIVLVLSASEPVWLLLEAGAAFSVAANQDDPRGPLLQPTIPAALGLGVHEGDVVLRVFVEREQRMVEVKGSPFAVPYRYEVTPPPLTASPASLRVTGEAGEADLEATLSLEGLEGAGPWTATVEPEAPWVTLEPPGGSAVPATVAVRVAYAYALEWAGEVVLRRHGSELRVPVSVLLTAPRITWDGGGVELRAVQGTERPGPEAEVVLGTSTGAACTAFAWALWTDVPYGWLTVEPLTATVPGTVRLRASTTLAPGTYRTTVQVSPQSCGGEALEIPVTLVLEPGAISFPTDPLWFALDHTSPASAGTRELPVTSSVPGTAITVAVENGWLTEAPWITATPSAAVPSPSLTLSVKVDPVALATGPLGNADMSVVVRWSEPDGTGVTRRIPVGRSVIFPTVKDAEPPAVALGPVTVVGPFEGLPCDPAYPIMFGDEAAVAQECLPSGVVRATPPALAPGTYPVWLWNALGVRRRGAELTVLAPAARAAAALPAPGRTTRIFFDERRGALFTVHPATGTLVRRREADGWDATSVPLPGLVDAVPQEGGARLLALTGAGLRLVDPSTLDVTVPYAPWPFEPEAAAAWGWTIAPARFGNALAVTSEVAGCADIDCWSYVVNEDGWLIRSGPMPGARIAASGDLSLALAVRHGFDPPLPLFSFADWVAGDIAGTSASATALAIDRTGSRILLLDVGPGGTTTRLLDGRYADLPGSLPATTAAALLSGDGTRAITFDGTSRTVRIFELDAPLAGGAFAEAGAGVAPFADPGGGVVLALSGDERTLFLAGDVNVVVVPLP